jgi:arylsulfatase
LRRVLRNFGENPAKLKELQTLFMKQAARNPVLPIDDRGSQRLDASIAGRPSIGA